MTDHTRQNEIANKTIWTDTRTVVIFICLYFLFEICVVVLSSNGAGLDDAEQLANISFFDWGYGGSQPPLYTWIVAAAAEIFGTKLLTLQIVKFSLLASLFLSFYAALRKFGFSSLVAAAGMLGLFLVPQIGWETQRALSHSVLGTAGCCYTLLAFACYVIRPKVSLAIMLGIAMAIALMGKFNTVLLIISLFIAGFSITTYRKALMKPAILAAPLVTLLLITPTVIWMIANRIHVVERINKFAIGASGNPLLDRINGVSDLITAAVTFAALPFIVMLICYILNRNCDMPHEKRNSDAEHLMWRTMLVGLAIILALVLFSGATTVKDRWLQPLLFALPLCLASALMHSRAGFYGTRAFGHAGVIFALLIPVGLIFYNTGMTANIQNAFNAKFGNKHENKRPPINQLNYKMLYEQVIKSEPVYEILSNSPHIPGNLRIYDPKIKVIHTETPDGAKRLEFPFFVLWTGSPNMPQSIDNVLRKAGIMVRHYVKHKAVNYLSRPDESIDIYYSYYTAL